MKITGRKSQQIGPMHPLGGAPTSEPAGPAEAAPAASEGDQIELASTTQVRKFAAAAKALPSVRMEKVVELREKVDDGSYYVESDKLARKVVDETINDLIAGELRQAQGR